MAGDGGRRHTSGELVSIDEPRAVGVHLTEEVDDSLEALVQQSLEERDLWVGLVWGGVR